MSLEKKSLQMKILYGNDVYIPASSVLKDFPVSDDYLRQNFDSVTIEGIGLCIPEYEFNRLLEKYPNLEYSFQCTRVDSLEVRAANVFKTYPLKRLFADKMFQEKATASGMSIEDYIMTVDFPQELEQEKRKLLSKPGYAETLERYKKATEELREEIPLEQYGLTLQQLTILGERPDNLTFLVGDGIFYQYYLDCHEGDDWNESCIHPDGTIEVPSCDYSDGLFVLKRVVDRDFRNYSVMDNILFCVHQVPARNEWSDYLEFGTDGINVSLNMLMIMKLLNPTNHPSTILIEGIPTVSKNPD